MSSELESDVCYRVYGRRHLVKATKSKTRPYILLATARLAESRPNGSPPPGGRLKVTRGLTACTPGSTPRAQRRPVTSTGKLCLNLYPRGQKLL